jgi:primosomal protein N'
VTEPRFVEVAVDAPGVPGGRTYTYRVPPALADLALGEAVLVEFGRRRAVGIVLAEGVDPGLESKPVLARVRSDGPLLGDLWRRLALHVAEHYLAPPGLVVRAMLPPGTLERIALFAVGSSETAGTPGEGPQDGLAALVTSAGEAGIAVDDLPARSSRATLLRELRQLEERGQLRLEWRIQAATARPRQERWAVITPAVRETAALLS